MPSLQEQMAAVNNSAPLPEADPWAAFPEVATTRKPDPWAAFPVVASGAPASGADPWAGFPAVNSTAAPSSTSPSEDFVSALDSSIFNAPARIVEATTGALASAVEPTRIDPVAWERQRQQKLSELQSALANEPVERSKSYIQAQIDSLQGASPPQQNAEGARSDQSAADWLRSIATDAAQHQQAMREQFGSTGAAASSTAGRIGAAIGQAPDILIPYAGPAVMLAEARQSGYQQAYDQAKAAGQSDDQAKAAADDAGNASFYKAAATLPLYGIQGAAVSKLVERVLPLGTPTAVRTAVNVAAHSASNVSASGEIRAASGEPFFSPESLPLDIGFGLSGGKHATAEQIRANAVERPIAAPVAPVEARSVARVPDATTQTTSPAAVEGQRGVVPIDAAQASVRPQETTGVETQRRSAPLTALDRALEENEPRVAPAVPTLRADETQGDLLSKQTEDLNLVGEKGVDYGARESAANAAAIEADKNAAAQDQQQGRLFQESGSEQEARQEHESELLRQAQESQSGHGDELLDAIDKSGGLPTPGSDTAPEYKGELRNALEMSKGGRQVGVKGVFQGKLFRSDAPHPDELATRLRDRGFNFQTPNDIFAALDQRLRTGRKVFGTPEMAQAMYSGPPMPDFLKVSPETHADVAGAVGGFFKPSKFTPFREVLNRWVGARQKATLQGEAIRDAIKREQPNVHRQAGISIYREAGGDTNLIRQQLAQAKSLWFKVAAREALRLTPNDVKIAARLDDWYNRKGMRAQANGLIEHLVSNYVPHMWESPPARLFSGEGGKLNTAFRPGKARTIPTLFEGDQAGLKPKSIVAGELASVYAHSMDRALGDRRFVKDLVNTTAVDGRPIGISQFEADQATRKFRGREMAINADANQTKLGPQFEDHRPTPTADYSDYKPIRHWAFKGEDYRGDILAHPDLANHIEAAIRPSTIDRPEYAATAAGRLARRAFQKVLSGQGFVKQNMLSIPAFHYVQEGTEAIGHHVNPFSAKPIDPLNPVHMSAMEHGLMVASTHSGEAQWMEGLNASRALLTKIPGIGPGLKASSEYLFRRYIPSLKMETYKAALNRNMDRFRKDLASGKMTPDDIMYHTAKQVNDAYGNLNYADLGRSENIQKITRAILLAPDFLEARARQALQGAAGLIPGQLARAHGEQRMAFWTLAVGQYVLARALNYQLDDKKLHLDLRDAFAVYHNGRRYTMRSVPGDVLEALTETRKFLMARLSPLVGRTALEFATGTNYKGQKVTGADQLRDAASSGIPIGLRNAAARLPGLSKVGDPDKSLAEEAVSSLGVKTNRASPIIDAHLIAHAWMKRQPEYKEDTGTYPPSQYARLRNALEDNNQKAALSAYAELLNGTDNPNAVIKGFHSSMTKPFTKSRKGDNLMMEQLTPDERATVQQARELRAQILQRWFDLRDTPAASAVEQRAGKLHGIKEWLTDSYRTN